MLTTSIQTQLLRIKNQCVNCATDLLLAGEGLEIQYV
jgi:hypothetical protein